MHFDDVLIDRNGSIVPMPDELRLIATLKQLEDAVIEAGRQARALQGHVDVEMKAHSGNLRTDMVTRADRLVQAALLRAMVGTALTSCRLLAEETPEAGQDDLRSSFAADSSIYLTVDPIDGTRRYAENQPFYSIIVGLHNARRPLYTFMHYPAFGWWVRIEDRTLTTSGPPPLDLAHLSLERTIVYTAGDPNREIPKLAAQMVENGADIRFGESIGPYGSKFLYLSGFAGGYYGGKPNLYDGLFALHCAMARGNVILSQGESPGRALDLTAIADGPYGAYHPGWYLVVPQAI